MAKKTWIATKNMPNQIRLDGRYNGVIVNGVRSFTVYFYSRQVGGLSAPIKMRKGLTLAQVKRNAANYLRKHDEPIRENGRPLRPLF
jgi:hypothetical protein